MTISKEDVIEQMKLVLDPDLGVDIWTMGLIYDIKIRDERNVDITMTLTTPFCPAVNLIQEQMRTNLENIGVENTNIALTFEPKWEAPEELRIMLGI